MNRILFFILALTLILSIAGCGAPASEPGTGAEPTSAPVAEQTPEIAPVKTAEPPGDEYERAIWYGFLPDELASADPDGTTTTWAQYCEMLGQIIKLYDESTYPAWEELTKDAPDTEMKRDGAMVSLLFAAKTLDCASFNTQPPAAFQEYADKVWDNVTMDYPVFDWDTPVDLGDGCSDNNHVGPAYDFCLRRVSLKSDKSLLEFDENNDLRLEQPLTLREAALSALRLYESAPEKGIYIPIAEVGVYDGSIITDELLSAPSDLPEPTHSELPSAWKGAGMSARKDGRHAYMDFQEADIQFLADNGFNFTRVFLGFSTLRYPDYPEDLTLVNETEWKDLDRLIAWGIEHGVHIQLAMIDTPNGEESFDIDDAEWANTHAYWAALARRYAGIPSRYLSFDLSNEIEPGEENRGNAVQKMAGIVDDMREADPARLLLISFNGCPRAEWVESMAGLGLSLGCHPYRPTYLIDGDSSRMTAPAEPLWPYPYFPHVLEVDETLTISGDIGGKRLLLDFWVYKPFEISFSDGTVHKVTDAEGDYIDEMSSDWRLNEPYAVDIPEGATSLSLSPREDMRFMEIGLDDGTKCTWLAVHDCWYADSRGGASLVWEDAAGWSSEKNITPEFIYETLIAPQREIAARYGVGLMCNEFGIYPNHVGWDIKIATAFTGDMLRMFEEKGIPWCLCEAEGWPYRFLTAPDGQPYEWANATMKTVTYTYDDGGRTFQYCKELLDVFHQYTMD